MLDNIPNLYKIGKDLLDKYNLKQYRQYFKFDFNIDFNNQENTNKLIKHFVSSKLNIDFNDNYIDIIYKQIPEKGLNWHIDDCQIITKKYEPIYNKNRYIQICENKYLYFHNRFDKLPQKTIIFYSSTYEEDFDGGILKLCDDTEIKPKKNTGFVLDSREVHMVTPIKSGIRKVTVIKIY